MSLLVRDKKFDAAQKNFFNLPYRIKMKINGSTPDWVSEPVKEDDRCNACMQSSDLRTLGFVNLQTTMMSYYH